jgi:hypothetical protein
MVGITKLVVVMTYQSYFILSSIFGLIFHLYGNYIIDRFNLESKYPKLAIFIQYREKITKYYILSAIG